MQQHTREAVYRIMSKTMFDAGFIPLDNLSGKKLTEIFSDYFNEQKAAELAEIFLEAIELRAYLGHSEPRNRKKGVYYEETPETRREIYIGDRGQQKDEPGGCEKFIKQKLVSQLGIFFRPIA